MKKERISSHRGVFSIKFVTLTALALPIISFNAVNSNNKVTEDYQEMRQIILSTDKSNISFDLSSEIHKRSFDGVINVDKIYKDLVDKPEYELKNSLIAPRSGKFFLGRGFFNNR